MKREERKGKDRGGGGRGQRILFQNFTVFIWKVEFKYAAGSYGKLMFSIRFVRKMSAGQFWTWGENELFTTHVPWRVSAAKFWSAHQSHLTWGPVSRRKKIQINALYSDVLKFPGPGNSQIKRTGIFFGKFELNTVSTVWLNKHILLIVRNASSDFDKKGS